jgi:hypothetical protein
MKLVPLSEYERLKSWEKIGILPADSSTSFYMNKRDDAETILEDKFIPDDIKLNMYSSIIKKRNEQLANLQAKDRKIRKPIDEILKEKTSQHEILMKALPASLRWKGKFMLSALQGYPQYIKWNEKGQCTFFDEFENESNIVDLIRYSISSLKWKKQIPVGINRFLFVLKLINIPSSIVTSNLRDEFNPSSNVKPRGTRTSSIPTTFDERWQAYNPKDKTVTQLRSNSGAEQTLVNVFDEDESNDVYGSPLH